MSNMLWKCLCFMFVVSPLIHGHTILEELYCKDKNIEYGKSLRGGTAAGLFDNYGQVKNIQVQTFITSNCILNITLTFPYNP